ncbi:MAG: S8 family serine peptidase [Planctomycetota bacterium]|nr:S8 family serine peptidase [Planctomycetota bacterium]
MIPALLVLSVALLPQADKIDPRVRRAMGKDNQVDVILLGRIQLLDGHKGFRRFCKKNSKRKRSELRQETLRRLKEIAATEQAEILGALGNPDGAHALWIINAISVKLAPDAINKASKLEAIKYIYPGSAVPDAGAAGKVSQVLEPAERKSFELDGRQVSWNLKNVGADRVWSKLKVTGEGVVVAMWDSGVRYTHEDLSGNIWINDDEVPNNGKDDDENGYVDDIYGFDFGRMKAEVTPDPGGRPGVEHGTMTSGIVAGDGTGGTVTGVAPRARLMILKGSGRDAYVAGRVFQYALENGADIVNMSFSAAKLGNTRGLWRLISDQATCAGLVLVSGAGNFQRNQKIPVQMRIPEGIPSVICAGGVDENLKVPRFCSLGPVEWASVKFYEDFPMPKGLVKPDVCGFPGPRFPVLAAKDEGYVDPNTNIKGNSFSGPHVSGAAALVLSANPEIPAWRVKEILERTATDLGSKGKDTRTGAGLVNAYKAVKAAKKIKTH